MAASKQALKPRPRAPTKPKVEPPAQGLRCYAVAAPGLAPLVAAELRTLGIEGTADEGGVSWEGDLASLYRANLWLRTATRVIVRLATFHARSFQELERRAAHVPWGAFVQRGGTVAFRVTSKKSKLYHTGAVAERLARSISAAVRDVRVIDVPSHDEGGEDEQPEASVHAQLFVVRLSRDELTVSIDSSGAPLYQRGYRLEVARAPMRETLAAALLLSCGWAAEEGLVDPFCGSGTIPIEAALIARGIAPGMATAGRKPRHFGFVHWPGYDFKLWRKCVDDAASAVVDDGPLAIAGSDRDEGAIRAAKANADRAGVAGALAFATRPFSAMELPAERGWVVTNPPYGLRVGEQAEIRRLYAAFGRALFERAQGWGVCMLSPDPKLDAITGKESGLRLAERIRTRNGGIPVRVVVGRD